ncbi:hypothetical protein DV451_004845 [Geotrichum candidum]|uniref:Dopa 4,5-dioxygenase n=1 Tax=Geotrichum candidum TaxID=1173061 RepID=A0A9P5G243_GEOCN|nr:hypothetical protein DV451_004845 [Geotrichum candidum]KAF5108111.1 hypothetical protein DV453_002549 [Geotrichum candidum]
MSKGKEESFNEELKIKSYDIHTYYFQSNENSVKEATALRDKLAKDFAKDVENKDLNIYKLWDRPIGPHPYAMWECDFNKPELFARIVPWFQLNHGSLSVLVHPHTDKGSLTDHTDFAIWIGEKVPLITSVL